MLAYPIATSLLLLGQGSSINAAKKQSSRRATRKPHPDKPDFLRKMDGHKKHARRRLSVKEFHASLHGDSKKSAELRQKIVDKSTMVKPPGGGGDKRKLQNYDNTYNDQANGNTNNYNYNNQANGDANNYNNDANNGNGYNANAKYNTYNNQYNNNNNNYVYDEDGNIQYTYDNNRDGVDDYFQVNGDWENAFGFDAAAFSLSYHRCAAVRQFDDEIAAMEDTNSVFATKYFAVFRFCPTNTCMGWEAEEYEWECDEDTYGEAYCEALEEYMRAMEENAQNYQQYGNGWNGYNNEGNAQTNNWMDVNQGNYQNNGNYYNAEVQYDEEGNPQGQNYSQYNANCNCDQNAEEEDGNSEDNEAEEGDGEGCNCQNQQEGDDDNYGARGEGCDGNYGEYMMEMEEYLKLMLEWQDERFEQYCEYCEECMYDVYQTWLENGGQQNDNRKLNFEEFKNSEEHRNLGNDDDVDGSYYAVCPEYDTCSEYKNICQSGVDDSYSDYFECAEVESNNNEIAYVGPRCAEDGFTMTVGIYSDEYCNEYIGDGVEIANFIGEEVDYEEDMLKDYYNTAYGTTLSQLQYINEENVCIPCAESDLLWVDRANGNGNDDGDDDGYSDRGIEINELCENLYFVSARCDKHYRSYNNRVKNVMYAEAVAQEDLTCDFIDSIVMGNYNEMGEIDMGNTYAERQSGWFANNLYAQRYGESVSKVSPLQVFGLVASIAAVCTLAMWSMTLHKSLTKAGPWRPRNRLLSPAPVQNNAGAADLNRQNSGIVMGRSESNVSYYLS